MDYMRITYQYKGQLRTVDFWHIKGASPMDHVYMMGYELADIIEEKDIVKTEIIEKATA